MKGSRLLYGITAILSFFLMAAALAEDFSADMVSTTKEGKFEGKIFVTKDKMRMENPQSVTITRVDKNLAWMLMPSEKMYMEMPFDPRTAAAASEKVTGEIERTPMGTETIDGRAANKYRVVYEEAGKKETMFQWIDKATNIPLKTAAEDNSWTVEYKNIKTGSQPDSMFEIPEGYTKFSSQMPSMDNMFQ